jgi:hypothetical protein
MTTVWAATQAVRSGTDGELLASHPALEVDVFASAGAVGTAGSHAELGQDPVEAVAPDVFGDSLEVGGRADRVDCPIG